MLFTQAADGDWPTFESTTDTLTQPSVVPTRLREQLVPSRSLQVDRDARLVRNVAITGCVSRNGYRYTSEALSAAVPLYDGRPVFLDHANDPDRPRSRSTRDLVGTLESVRYVPSTSEDDAALNPTGMIRGDIRVLDTESGRTFLALCESNEPGVGMSHVVLARRSDDGSLVESIEKVISVDAVMFPATTTRLSESSLDDCCVECERRLAIVETERDQLRSDLERLNEAVRIAGRERQLAESGLPRSAISIVFRETVLAAESEVEAERLIRDRVALVRETVSQPTSEARDSAPAQDRGFVTAIRGG